jgi:FAD dependent oxidoreductase
MGPPTKPVRFKPDAIAMGSYNTDSHNVQRYVTAEGNAQNEGNLEVGVTPYQIPYRVLLPKCAQATNLLVPVCVSASHVAYATLRMEPQYMMIGQAAGVAAKMAWEKKLAVQDVDTASLKAKLLSLGAVMVWNPPTTATVGWNAIGWVVAGVVVVSFVFIALLRAASLSHLSIR